MTTSADSSAGPTADPRATVGRYWTAADLRDWDTFAATLADEVVYDLPQTRERIRGKEPYLAFNREYPGDWRVRVERIVADRDGRQVAVRTLFTVDGQELHAVHFFTFDAQGRIDGITDFWPEPYEPPAGREHLVERY
ncbi:MULTISPECIES: nuclear transport factor 2 family protein [unclassified Streptomyces]|uniref:nuclear transport factor 2 family protein n=1 Tax=unclassified Streptomyces TaxID=2593676 RepID=UPI002255F766|nr:MULTISPECIES: nuclear transport factor 2 family protein [unclassified Streptomyces]MCX5141206.1 nuclear transport factor 2 family protein [Streptomyces sp. NBC_00338]WSU59719.1 nuclear transport factor 2 family protein [Streptomyces sp. NBC_01104]